MMRAYENCGWLLVAIGTLHNVLGVVLGWPFLVDIVQAGIWNSIEPDGELIVERSAILWFLLTGSFWWLLGGLMQSWLHAIKTPLPTWLGWGLFLAGVVVAILLPVSGAWLFIALGLLVVFGAPTARREAA